MWFCASLKPLCVASTQLVVSLWLLQFCYDLTFCHCNARSCQVFSPHVGTVQLRSNNRPRSPRLPSSSVSGHCHRLCISPVIVIVYALLQALSSFMHCSRHCRRLCFVPF